jgi:hypothetical protein
MDIRAPLIGLHFDGVLCTVMIPESQEMMYLSLHDIIISEPASKICLKSIDIHTQNEGFKTLSDQAQNELPPLKLCTQSD